MSVEAAELIGSHLFAVNNSIHRNSVRKAYIYTKISFISSYYTYANILREASIEILDKMQRTSLKHDLQHCAYYQIITV